MNKHIAAGVLFIASALTSAKAQGATEARPDSSTVSKSDCKGNFLSRAMCKGATKITQAALGAGVIAPPKMGTIAPPALPIFGTYRIRLLQEGADSLTFFVRTILPLDTRVPDGEWVGYGARFVSALTEGDLPASLDAAEAKSPAKVGGGPMLFLTSIRDSTRFAVNLPLMLPMMHPTVMGAKGTWLEEAVKSAPPLSGFSPKEYKSALNGHAADAMGPSRFVITWNRKNRVYSMKAERVSDAAFRTQMQK